MINSVKITNHLGEVLTVELRFPEKSGFLLAHISGLEPPKASVVTTELAAQDGSVYNTSRVSNRNIVFTLVFGDKYSPEEARLLTYKYFPIKKRVSLEFITETRQATTYGYVESNAVNIFSPRVATQISIVCPDPYFYSSALTYTSLSGIDPLFEFPFSNESLSQNLIEISQILNNTIINVPYYGEADTGMIIRIYALGAAENIVLFNELTGETFSLITDLLYTTEWDPQGLTLGDELIVSSIRGDKYVKFLRNGVYYNMLNMRAIDSKWLMLRTGDNLIGYYASSGENNLQVRIENPTLYEGL
jgi:hypothetical protein